MTTYKSSYFLAQQSSGRIIRSALLGLGLVASITYLNKEIPSPKLEGILDLDKAVIHKTKEEEKSKKVIPKVKETPLPKLEGILDLDRIVIHKTKEEEKSEKLKKVIPNAKDALYYVSVKDINGRDYNLTIPEEVYFTYKSKTHRANSVKEFTNWVTYNDEIVKQIATNITNGAKSSEEKAKILLKFVHSHIYDASIEQERDYVRYPLETIIERNGDCEDLSILGAALMKSIGIDVALLHFNGNPGHIALGINGDFSGSYYEVDNKKYYYAEATGTDFLSNRANWKIGQIPSEFLNSPAGIYIVR